MLNALLEDEITVVSELHGLLLREHGALKNRQLEELEQVTEAKELCMDRLQGLVAQRFNQLQQVGLDRDNLDIETFIEAVRPDDSAQLRKLWADLVAVSAQAHRQNTVNGAIIAASRNHLEQALGILRGHPSQECLYGQSAQKTFRKDQRPLARV